MRQLAVVLILLLAMFTMKTLAIESQEGFNPLLLAAIGFVILASFSAGDLVNRLRIPRVTGYVLAGLLLGPQIFNILSEQVVDGITMFNTLALGLIALGAGLELEIESIKSVSKTLLGTILTKMFFLFPLIAGSVVLIDMQFGLTGATDLGIQITVGLVMATLALGTSPAIALAVIEETGKHGRVSKLVLGSAVVKDIIMVLALAVTIAAGTVLATPDASFSYGVVFDLLGEISLSALVGGLIGGLLILYMRYIKQDMLVVVALVIIATAELSSALHLELLLVFIVAGFIVTNFSEFGHELMKPIRTVSLPVFVIFFTSAGAKVDLPKVQELLPFALSVFAIRLLGLVVSHKVGAHFGKEEPEVKRWGWLGYIPQAGVTLGLMEIASQRLPEVAPYFVSLALGMVVANLLIGPLTLRLALMKSETTDGEKIFNEEEPKEMASGSNPYDVIRVPELREAVADISKRFEDSIQNDGSQKQLLGQEAFIEFIETLPEMDITPSLTQRPSLEKISDFLKVESEDFIATQTRLAPLMDSCRQIVQVGFDKEDFRFKSNDSFGIAFRKINLRVLAFVKGDRFMREVPLQTVAKIHFNVFAARHGRYMLGLWYNSGLKSFDQIRVLLDGGQTKAEAIEVIREIWSRFHASFEAELKASFGQLAVRVSDEVNRAGTAYADADSYRFSEYEPKIKKYLNETSERRETWNKKQTAVIDSVMVYSILDHLRTLISRTLEERCIIPLETLKLELHEEGQVLVQHLSGNTKSKKVNEKEILDSCETLNAKMRDQYLVLSSMRMLSREISGNLNRLFDAEKRYEVLSLETLGQEVEDPASLRFVRVQFAANLNRTIFSILFPPVERLIDRVSEILDTFQDELDDVKKTLNYAIESQDVQSGALVLSSGEVQNLFSNVTYKIEENLETVEQALGQVREKVDADVAEAFKEAQEILQSQNVIRTARSSWLDFLSQAQDWFEDKFSVVIDDAKKLGKRIQIFAKSFEDTPAAEEMSRRLKSGDLDAIVIKDYISDRVSAPLKLERLPQIYRRLFTLDPLRDSRLFSANRKVLDSLPLGDDPDQAHRVLIVGKSGMGKSSLLNVAEMMAVDTRVVRLDRNYGTTHLSLISLLARQIGSSNSTRDILINIAKKPTTVIMDNMDHWWSPGSHDDVSRLMEIIARSGPAVNWIASVDSFNYKLFTQAFSIRSLFHRVEMLQPLNHKQMEEVILHRNELSGLDVEYTRGFGVKLFDRVWHSGPQEIYFEILKSASGGNIRSAVQHWVQSIDWIDNREVRVHIPRIAAPNLGFLESFNYESLLILKELYRFGPRSVRQLIQETHIRDNVLAREVESLRQSGLVVNKSRDGHIVQVDPMIKYYLGEQLASQQVI